MLVVDNAKNWLEDGLGKQEIEAVEFNSLEEALLVIGSNVGEPHAREEAWRFIHDFDPDDFVEQLITELQNDQYWVRWEAAELLAQMGCAAMTDLLHLLVELETEIDPRLRDGVYHVFLGNRDPYVREVSAALQKALFSAASTIETKREAKRLLEEMAGC